MKEKQTERTQNMDLVTGIKERRSIRKRGTPIRDKESTMFPQMNSGEEEGYFITKDALIWVISTVMIATVLIRSRLLFQLFFSAISISKEQL